LLLVPPLPQFSVSPLLFNRSTASPEDFSPSHSRGPSAITPPFLYWGSRSMSALPAHTLTPSPCTFGAPFLHAAFSAGLSRSKIFLLPGAITVTIGDLSLSITPHHPFSTTSRYPPARSCLAGPHTAPAPPPSRRRRPHRDFPIGHAPYEKFH